VTPVQQWFFRQALCRVAVLESGRVAGNPAAVESYIREQAVQRLLIQHDAFAPCDLFRVDSRLESIKCRTRRRQRIYRDRSVPDSGYSADRDHRRCGVATARLSRPFRRALLRVALLNLGAGQPGRLLIVIHHLAVDGVSWRIIIEDLQILYQQLECGQNVQLPQNDLVSGMGLRRWQNIASHPH